MRFVVNLLVMCLMGASVFGQSSEEIAFIQNLFGQSAKLIYTDKLGEYEVKRMEKALSKDTLYDVFVTNLKDPNNRLVLTRPERNYIQQELASQSKVTWSSQLFEHGKRITQASSDSLQAGFRIYSFSNPIFIRNHSLCIFYSGYTCSSRCGEGKLVIFKKQNDTWVAWLELYRWIS
ncbi:hypothetical protein [Spirosoma aerolatum]|uniref:hypothetical protein n=1 Tax=Spirosoma aerolatum TaxID=1211326 RepID=UPI0009AD0DC2|nr:hypothetical protein [Spirosoma aerolatum]